MDDELEQATPGFISRNIPLVGHWLEPYSKHPTEATAMTYAKTWRCYPPKHLLGLTLGTALLVGCAGAPMTQSGSDMASESMPPAELDQSRGNMAQAPTEEATSADAIEAQGNDPVEQLTPQLVKQASLVLVLSELDQGVARIQEIVRQAQGDVLSLQDYRSPEGVAHQITLTARVPQDRLEAVLEDIQPLGTIQEQSLTAEDVSSQLVDLEARLRNLRKSEEALLEIMDRSGDIADVLEVSRELSQVRESIERIAAQQQSLQRRVAYSTLNLTLKSPTTAVAPLRPAGETLGNTWQAATRSVKVFTVGALKMSLWLLAYSPYLVVLGLVIWGSYRLRHQRPSTPERPETDHA
jgi:hypothetical protein